MIRRKPVSFVFIIVGVAVILIALFLMISERQRVKSSAPDKDETLAFLCQILPEPINGIKENRYITAMPVVNYKGSDFAAVIECEKYGTKNPVLAQWNERAISRLPCVFYGNPYEGSLVIGGSDKEGQFDFIFSLDKGDEITITDMSGHLFKYYVAAIKHSSNANTSSVINQEADLTLFVKSSKDGLYTIVSCSMHG